MTSVRYLALVRNGVLAMVGSHGMVVIEIFQGVLLILVWVPKSTRRAIQGYEGGQMVWVYMNGSGARTWVERCCCATEFDADFSVMKPLYRRIGVSDNMTIYHQNQFIAHIYHIVQCIFSSYRLV